MAHKACAFVLVLGAFLQLPKVHGSSPTFPIQVQPSEKMRVSPHKGMNISAELIPKLRDLIDEWTVQDIYWNLMPVQNAMMRILCSANIPANYQNPFFCYEFIMCDTTGLAFLAQCPDAGDTQRTGNPMTYNPFPDLCVYTRETPQCPFRDAWNNRDVPPTCENIGQRPWWGYLTLSREPEVKCTKKIMYCHRFQKMQDAECAEGDGYSKALLACVPYLICMLVEDWLQMPYPYWMSTGW